MPRIETPGGSDTDAIHDNVAGEISAIAEKAAPVAADLIIIEDSAAANAKKRVQIGNLPGGAVTGTFSIPFYVMGVVTAAPQSLQFADENATNRIRLYIPVPLNWDGTTDLTVKTLWAASATGLGDLENYIDYVTEVDENSPVLIQDWTNRNLTWSGANTMKMITTTIAAASLAAGRHIEIYFRRNTGDPNTGTVTLGPVHVTTGLSF